MGAARKSGLIWRKATDVDAWQRRATLAHVQMIQMNSNRIFTRHV